MTNGTGGTDQFRLAFREEARELLVELESNLLEMNERPEDAGLVGHVFRALHTIKGSGAMFGFDNLAGFTHNIENAFDEVRKGHLPVTPELVDLTLSALDQIRAMIEQNDQEAAPDPAACEAILMRLRALMDRAESASATGGQAVNRGGKPENESGVPPSRTGASMPRAENEPERAWRIRFAPGPDLMRNGADPLLLLRELRGLGQLTVEASTAGIPPIEELEPERCYVSWTIVLTIPGKRECRQEYRRGRDSGRLHLCRGHLRSRD